MPADLQQHPGSDLRGGALRPAGASAGVFPPREAVPANRDRVRDAVRVGELLLAVHVRLGAGEHDPRVHRDQGVPAVPEPGLPHAERVDGADDHGQGAGGGRDQEVRGDARMGEEQDQGQEVEQGGPEGRVQVHHGEAQQRPETAQDNAPGAHQGEGPPLVGELSLLERVEFLHRLSFFQIVLPSKAIRNEKILETLMYQANSGIYRNVDSYLEAYQKKVQNQESFDCGI